RRSRSRPIPTTSRSRRAAFPPPATRAGKTSTRRAGKLRRSRSRSTASSGRRPRPAPTPLDVAARLLKRAPETEARLEARLVALGYRRETAWARRALGGVCDRRRAWRLLLARGFPEQVVVEVLGEVE